MALQGDTLLQGNSLAAYVSGTKYRVILQLCSAPLHPFVQNWTEARKRYASLSNYIAEDRSKVFLLVDSITTQNTQFILGRFSGGLDRLGC